MKPKTEAGRVRLDLTTLPMHTLLLSLYAVLAMLAANIHELDASDAYRSAGVAIALAVILSLAWWLAVRNGPRAGVLASLCLLAFYSYGHAYTLLLWASNPYGGGPRRTVSFHEVVPGQRKAMVICRASRAPPTSSTAIRTAITIKVIPAFFDSGLSNEGTPLLMASMPVSAVQPVANVCRIRNSVIG